MIGQPEEPLEIGSMSGIYDRITRIFLNAADPYTLSDYPPKRTVWAYIKSHMRPLRGIFVAGALVTVLAGIVEVWLIQYAGRLVDKLVASDASTFWMDEGRGLFLAAMVVIILRPVAQFLRMSVNDIALDCNAANLTRWRAYNHLIRQSVGWFQEDLTGRTSTRLVEIGNNVADTFHKTMNAVGYGLVYMVGVVVLMAGVEVWLALPLLVWLALYVAILTWVIPRMINAQHRFQSAKSALVGTVVDGFSNFDTLQLFAPKNQIANELHGRLEDTRHALYRTRQIGVGLRTSLVALEAVVMVGFIGYGVWLWSVDAATVGTISAAVALSIRITTMADFILDSIWWTFLRVGSLREALETIAQPIAIPQKADAQPLKVTDGGIEITELRHHYGLEKGGLNGVSLTVEPGEKVGIVGRSGAGKSTLVNLILRFSDAEKGTIKIDGQDIRDVDQDSLRAAIGMVSQQAALLNRSVGDNILLGREDVPEEALIKATKEARAHDFIMGLRDNKGREDYDAHVGERGVKLSGGQRQRVAIARVILKDAPILILDEATSALDSQVEAEIQDSLIGVMENKTVIAIAHRLSTIARMDRIVVMDDGRIVEEGTHDALIAKAGVYAGFWDRQSRGFINTSDQAAE